MSEIGNVPPPDIVPPLTEDERQTDIVPPLTEDERQTGGGNRFKRTKKVKKAKKAKKSKKSKRSKGGSRGSRGFKDLINRFKGSVRSMKTSQKR